MESNHRHTDFQSVAQNSQPPEKQILTTPDKRSLQTSVQTKSKNGQNQAQDLPADLVEIVAVWPELPQHIKAAIKALIQTYKAEKK